MSKEGNLLISCLQTGVVGLEPTAANLEDWYSIQLSYTPIIGSPDRA